ncbi:hypothetical protein JAAARDRAFT_120667 [Jaapia argillacea MUCL 33604]|uniref:TatD DNase family Scn1 n=1 Tax=Jaapia argillacea MUCL 33604 TaxID=933084 RepID=A0A067QHX0_9AGAM|nr:hypothetical protein JAAARDRAFT_120667 [Jaapia argillacea MUCL 33604]
MTEPSSETVYQADTLPSPAVLRHVIDVHCHPTDSEIPPVSMDRLPIKICAMATRGSDQSKVADLATAYPEKVIPCFGYHPWFTHLISLANPPSSKEDHYTSLFLPSSVAHDPTHVTALHHLLETLPDPVPVQEILSTLRQNLLSFPNAMLGEVGLDRSARVPFHSPTGSAHSRVLSPFTIPIQHQQVILERQFDLAVELKRNVSVHSVKAQQSTLETFKKVKDKWGEKWEAISIDMHSCGVSPETWKGIEASLCTQSLKIHSNVFLSLSTVINSRSPAHTTLIATCSPNRILVESDIHIVDLCTQHTWDMVKIVASVKGWRVEEFWDYGEGGEGTAEQQESWGVVKRLEENWKLFQRGNHFSKKSKKKDRIVKSKLANAKVETNTTNEGTIDIEVGGS